MLKAFSQALLMQQNMIMSEIVFIHTWDEARQGENK